MPFITRSLTQVINTPYVIWFLLAWPAWPLLWDLIENNRYYAEIMHVTGVLSVQLLVVTLSISPVSLVLKRWHFGKLIGRWLVKNRRYLGVAAFGYALLHLVFYVREVQSLYVIYLEMFDVEFFVGWLGFLFLLPPFLTSNIWAVRVLGTRWKRLQQMSYIAVVALFIHWFFFDFFLDQVLFWGTLLAGTKTIHITVKLFKNNDLKPHLDRQDKAIN